MKQTIITLLLKVLMWLGHETLKPEPLVIYVESAPLPEPKFRLPDIPDDIMERASRLTAALADQDAAGEWKRHQCYAALIKNHPDTSRRILALAIEVALCSD